MFDITRVTGDHLTQFPVWNRFSPCYPGPNRVDDGGSANWMSRPRDDGGPVMKTARTPTLEIAYEESGPAEGPPVVLLHGFPDDVRAYDGVGPSLAAAGWRVLVPYLRGYGPTRFLDPRTPRSGQQAALGRDLVDFLDALGIERAALGGYDWGGRAACIVAALWPDRVTSSGLDRRLQHPEHRPLGRTGYARSRASSVVPVVFPRRARRAPGSRQTADRSAGCCGNYGRRTGGSMTRPSSGPRYPSTIPISSRW